MCPIGVSTYSQQRSTPPHSFFLEVLSLLHATASTTATFSWPYILCEQKKTNGNEAEAGIDIAHKKGKERAKKREGKCVHLD